MFVAMLLLGITVLVCAVQYTAFRRLYNYVDRDMKRPLSDYKPRATVILPCKGLDPGFNENVEKLLKQDYQRFDVIFAVASEPANTPEIRAVAAAARAAMEIIAVRRVDMAGAPSEARFPAPPHFWIGRVPVS